MLRPTTLLRPFTAPSRLLTAQFQFTPSTLIARRCFATETATTSSIPPSTRTTETTTTTNQPKPQPRAPTPPTNAHPYHVPRTPYNQLPVYHAARRGGNMKVTVIKRVQGNPHRFREAIASQLGLDAKTVRLNTSTKSVTVSGHKREEIKQWLEQQGF